MNMPKPLEIEPTTARRGTIIVLHGRGENPNVFERFGHRLAFDGYRVVVPSAEQHNTEFVSNYVGLGEPLILIGHDVGAVRAWQISLTIRIDALIISGAPVESTQIGGGGRDVELEARTACPIHRARLLGDAHFEWGTLDSPIRLEFPAQAPTVPALFVHGAADTISGVSALVSLADRVTDREVAVYVDGRHDILNDKMHRSVAARIILFVETVCKGNSFHEPLRVDSAQPVLKSRRTAPFHVSARITYALAAMAAISEYEGGPIKCEQISQRKSLPLNSLVNIMSTLRRAGLIVSHRGCDGGYELARHADAITVADVVRAIEGSLTSYSVTESQYCVWTDVDRAITSSLESWTLQNLCPSELPIEKAQLT